jgi:hypothetical protein
MGSDGKQELPPARFRPHGKTWAEKAKLPKDGDPITVANALSVVKEGCKQAIAEDRKEAGARNAACSIAEAVNSIPPATLGVYPIGSDLRALAPDILLTY